MMMRFSRFLIGYNEWEKPSKWSNDNEIIHYEYKRRRRRKPRHITPEDYLPKITHIFSG